MKPRSSRTKIRSAAALKRLLRGKRRVVFTNGCFDLLHRGHVTYLARARGLGDCLVVALNSDSSVKKLKGPGRPLNPLQDRLEVIAALECVDYVTWFSQETPEALIHRLSPKILVKGGDWKPEQIVGAKEVLSRGGEVYSLPYVKGKSTTKLIAKAQKKKN